MFFKNELGSVKKRWGQKKRTGPQAFMTSQQRGLSRRAFLTSSCALGLIGCTVGEDFSSPTMKLSNRFGPTTAGPVRTNDAQWWKAFNDPLINQIVDLGLKQNLDIRRIGARIQQSQGIVQSSGFPISGNARVAEAKVQTGGGESTQQTGLVRAEATWKIDLIGRLKREREAAYARLDAAYADLDVWRLLLVEEVVSAYIDMRFAQEVLRIQYRVLASREKTLEATRKAVQHGGSENEPQPPSTDTSSPDATDATELDVAQAKALVQATRANIPESRIAFGLMLNRIIRLLGGTELPNRERFDIRAPQPVARTKVVNTGVPADLLRNRPDIVRAEYQLAEAVALLGVAEADLYPQLELTGNVNLNYSNELLPGAGFVLLGLNIPIFDIPVRKGRVETAKGLIQEREANWEEKVVIAVEEVRNAMLSLQQHSIAVVEARKAVEAARQVLTIAREKYIDGSAPFLQVLDAERAFLSTEISYALDLRNQARDFVNLNVAIGGSFGPKPPARS